MNHHFNDNMVSCNDDDENCCIPDMRTHFEDPKDEASYWKELAKEYVEKLRETRNEFDDFQAGSHDLETELEANLEQYERKISELTNYKNNLEKEVEMYRKKMELTERENQLQVSKLVKENKELKLSSDEMAKYIRELEQSNDDLERAKRETISTLEDFDDRLNDLIERNAFLENELEEKELLAIQVQRNNDFAIADLDDTAELVEEDIIVDLDSAVGEDASVDLDADVREDTAATLENSVELELLPKNEFAEMSDCIDEGISCPHECPSSLGQIIGSSQTQNTNTDTEMNKPFGLVKISNDDVTRSSKVLTVMSEQQRVSALDILTDLLWKVGNLESKFSYHNLTQEPFSRQGMNAASFSKKHKGKKRGKCINLSRLLMSI